MKCFLPVHPGLLCKDASGARINSTDDKKMKKGGFQQCPSCKVFREKDGGCNKMTCDQCHTYWCAVCHEEISEKVSYGHFGVGKCAMFPDSVLRQQQPRQEQEIAERHQYMQEPVRQQDFARVRARLQVDRVGRRGRVRVVHEDVVRFVNIVENE